MMAMMVVVKAILGLIVVVFTSCFCRIDEMTLDERG